MVTTEAATLEPDMEATYLTEPLDHSASGQGYELFLQAIAFVIPSRLMLKKI